MDHTRIGAETHADGAGITARIDLHSGRGAGAARPDPGILSAAREIAAEAALRARDGVQVRAVELGRTLDARTGLLTAARDRPLLAVGAAFSIGFLVAAATAKPESHWFVERIRRQLRTVIVGGAAAILAQELRTLAGADEGFGEMLATWLGGDEDELGAE